MMKIFLSGCTGLVGNRLVPRLIENGHIPVVLTRRPDFARDCFGNEVVVVSGNPTVPGPWQKDLESCEGAINLAGENIFARRWSPKFKKLLESSRVQSTKIIAETMMKKPRRADGTPKVFVNASAVGIYGPRKDEEVTEA
ncbi:MAG: NAD-dependent epimerase/dehydratase family protein, partial [Gemmataceae bacterium]